MNEKVPPVKSSSTFANDHPTVDFLFQLRYTCGKYFTKVMAALQYPAILIVPQDYLTSADFVISRPNIEKIRINCTAMKATTNQFTDPFYSFPVVYMNIYVSCTHDKRNAWHAKNISFVSITPVSPILLSTTP